MLMFGYYNELCGEHSFGWSKRLMLVHPTLSNPNTKESDRVFPPISAINMPTLRKKRKPHLPV